METLRVKDWDRYQHYGKRNPPWIKFYRVVLEDYTIASLPDVAKAHLFGIWLLAASTEGEIPNDPAWVGTKINATEPVDLQRLIDLGLLLASGASIRCYHQPLASVEERRGEQRREDLSAVPTNGTPGALALTPDPEPPPKPRKKRDPNPDNPPPNWVADAATMYEALVGIIPPGRIGRALKPAVEKYGWTNPDNPNDCVRRWWDAYCRYRPYQRSDGSIWGDRASDVGPRPSPNMSWTTPEDFIKGLAKWRDECTLPSSR